MYNFSFSLFFHHIVFLTYSHYFPLHNVLLFTLFSFPFLFTQFSFYFPFTLFSYIFLFTLLSSIIIFTLLYSPLLIIQFNLLFYCSTILFMLLRSPLCTTPLSFSHCYAFLCTIFLFRVVRLSYSYYFILLFALLSSFVHVILLSCSWFVFLFTLLHSPLCATQLSFALFCSPFCIVPLSFLHYSLSYFRYKVFHTTTRFFMLLLLALLFVEKSCTTPCIPSCKSWEWSRVDSWPLVFFFQWGFFSLCFLSHLLYSFVLIFLVFFFVVHG